MGKYLFGDNDFASETCSSKDTWLQDLRSIILAFTGTETDHSSSLKFCFMDTSVLLSPSALEQWAADNVNASCVGNAEQPCGSFPITLKGLEPSSDDLTPGGVCLARCSPAFVLSYLRICIESGV